MTKRVWGKAAAVAGLSLLGAFGLQAVPTTETPPAPVSGKSLYQSHCMACHMPDGGGAGMMQPALVGSPIVTGAQAGVIDMALKGSNSKIAQGVSMNMMPGFATLKDTEIAAIVTYIRTEFAKKSDTVTAKQVAEHRKYGLKN